MHKGFQLLKRQKKVVSFEEHESLAYGLDFKQDFDHLELASCSFYDCLLKIWEVVETG